MSYSGNSRLLIIGIGQDFRGDDAAGLVVTRQLREKAESGVIILENSGAMTDLLEAWKEADAVILVDAIRGVGSPGEIFRFPVNEGLLPANLSAASSTHAWGVAQAVALGRVLKQLPSYLVIYGIVGRDFDLGQELSREVAEVVTELVIRIVQEINEYFGKI